MTQLLLEARRAQQLLASVATFCTMTKDGRAAVATQCARLQQAIAAEQARLAVVPTSQLAEVTTHEE